MSQPTDAEGASQPADPSPLADQQALVLHEDALDAACQAASRSIDQLIWQGSADVAKSVTLFGPGIVVLPLFGKVSGVPEHRCLAYAAHPKRVARGGLMDRVDFESKFGMLDPGRLVDELAGGRAGLERRLRALSDAELHDEVVALQDWREKANGRLRTLEKRAAWAFLGMPPGAASSQSAIKKAFKKRALELHPDKGGDAERFQLLQEMKELLIVPTAKELEELEKEAKEREAEVEKAKEKEKERERERQKKKDEAEEAEADFSDISSDSSYDVDEEFKKMFPDFKKKKRREKRQEEETADAELDLGVRENFNRDRHEAARRKLHRSFLEMWERAGKLSEEIRRAQAASGGDALRQLRKFVDRFANLEISKLRENDPKKAERLFRRFLEQGSEVLCAAGAVDPLATVSSVAMQVNYPLLAVAPSPELEQRCNALVEAIKSLPTIFNNYVSPAEDVAVGRREAARAQGLALTLLVPDPKTTAKQADGLELPGIAEERIELPPGSTLGDLRAAALHMCGRGELFHKVVPRLFCGGQFLAGADSKPLSEMEVLRAGIPVQCLPSNRIFRPQPRPSAGSAAAAQVPAPQPAQPAVASSTPPVGSSTPQDPPRATGDPATTPTPVHKPSPELLAALGVGGQSAAKEGRATKAQEVDRKAEKEQEQRAAEARKAAEHRAKEEVERKAAEDEGGEEEEDPWFDDFFSDAKKAADSQTEKQRRQEEERAEAARVKKRAEEEEEAKRHEEEKQKRKTTQEAGQNSMEARLRAQKEAKERQKKLEKEKKKLAEAKKKTEGVSGDIGKERSEGATTQAPVVSSVREIVKAKQDPTLTVQRRRTSWDESWSHPCAGERRSDGKAIWCYPCGDWIHVGDPFDHRAFELHCEKVGHYGWID